MKLDPNKVKHVTCTVIAIYKFLARPQAIVVQLKEKAYMCLVDFQEGIRNDIT